MRWVVSKRRTAVSSGVPANTSPSRPSLSANFRPTNLALISGDSRFPFLANTQLGINMRRCCELLPFLVGGRPECAHQVEVLQSSDVSALTTSPPVSCPSLQNTARLLNEISLPSFVSSWRPEGIWCAKRRSSTSVGSSTSVEILSLQLAFLLLWRCLSKTLWGFDQENSLSMTMVLSLFDSSRCSRSLTRCLPASGYLCSFGLAVAPSSNCSTPLMVVISTSIAPRGAASAPQASLLLLEPGPLL